MAYLKLIAISLATPQRMNRKYIVLPIPYSYCHKEMISNRFNKMKKQNTSQH